MFQQNIRLGHYRATLAVNAKTITIECSPFVGELHQICATIDFDAEAVNQSNTFSELSIKGIGATLSGSNALAHLNALREVTEYAISLQALSNSLASSGSDAMMRLINVAESGDLDDLLLHAALIPSPRIMLLSSAKYHKKFPDPEGIKPANLLVAILRHPAFGVAKETTLRFLCDQSEDSRELKQVPAQAQKNIRFFLTLFNRALLLRPNETLAKSMLLLERNDLEGYNDLLMSRSDHDLSELLNTRPNLDR